MRLSSLIAITFAAACASVSSSASSSPSASASPSAAASPSGAPKAVGRTYTANVTPTGATTSRMSGTLTLAPTDASTYGVSMEFRGAPTSRQLPWAIRPGACGDATPNSDIGSRSAYGPIQTAADGQAHINTRLRVQLPDQTLHVDIMQSNSQRDVVVACGVLLAR